jgi:ABC-2 type transport system ATP-binding protein
VLVSSHLISEMALTAERLVVIGQGRLLADTTVAALSATASSLEEAFLALTAGVTSYQGTAGPGGAGQNRTGHDRTSQSDAGQETVAGQTGRVS